MRVKFQIAVTDMPKRVKRYHLLLVDFCSGFGTVSQDICRIVTRLLATNAMRMWVFWRWRLARLAHA